MTNSRLPRSIEELTPNWLSAALGERFPGIEVTGLDIVQVISGTTTKIRLKVSYANGIMLDGPPETLCVKGGFDERLHSFNTAALYQLEANFFRYLAPRLSMPLPRCWFAAAEKGQGIVIFDDLVATGARFWLPTEAWTVDMVAAALESLAALHAGTWGMDAAPFPWLTHGSPQVQAMIPALFSDENWNDMLSRPDARFVPPSQLDRDRMMRAFSALWRRDAEGPMCLIHWDPHIGNTYIDAGGQIRFVDWQCVCVAPYIHDVAYLIAGAMAINDRRAHERHLLDHYLVALHRHGGPQITADAVWLDYRRYQLYGFLWVLSSTLMQPVDIVAALTERHAVAIDDHETLAILSA